MFVYRFIYILIFRPCRNYSLIQRTRAFQKMKATLNQRIKIMMHLNFMFLCREIMVDSVM